jgi:hypothetical protein
MYFYRNIAIVAVLTFSLTACDQQTDVAEDNATAMEANTAAMAEDTSAMATATCDRACIIGVTDAYIAALVAHEPGAAPLSGAIRFVENVTARSPGEGLWQSIVSAPGSFAIYVPDEVNQTAGYLGMMTYMAAPPAPQGTSPEARAEWQATAEKIEQPVLVALRLKLNNGEITEAEHLLTGIREDFLSNLQTPRAGLLAEVPEDMRMENAQLIKIGASYYDALDDNDGTLMPFAEDCERHENGMVTAGPNAGAGPNNAGTGTVARDCIGQLDSKVMTYIDRIENRRVFAADPVTGLVMGLSHFRHSMNKGPYEVINMDGSIAERNMDQSFAPFDLPAAHIYKIGADGKVHEIEAMGFMAPYNSPTGWEGIGD